VPAERGKPDAAPVAPAAQGNTPVAAADAMDTDATALHLRVGKIALKRESSLHLAPAQVTEPQTRHILQLDGPLTPEINRRLGMAGITLGQYLPANSYIVRFPAGTDISERVRGLNFVRWIGPYQKAWKLDPEIGQQVVALGGFESDRRRDIHNKGNLLLTVTLFEGSDLVAAVDDISRMEGVQIHEIVQGRENGLLEIEMPAGTFPLLADVSAVQWVEEAPEATFRNDTNRWVVQSNSTGLTPVWDRGIRGEGQIGGLIDGAVRTTHCSVSDPGGNPVGSPSHRKIIYYFGATGQDSHGTHTAGTFVGDEQPVSGGTAMRGLAHQAKMAFTNLSSVSSTNFFTRLENAHNAGARVHSNSWGNDGTTSYIQWCRDIDMFSHTYEESLVLFAVTNLNSTVKAPENAKNVLAVAASRDTPQQNNHCSGGRAPTVDGRRKPEIMAPGCSTQSSSSSTTCGFTGMTGTSMACPAVAGAALLVRQYYMDGFYPNGFANSPDAFTPSGALIKATLLNSSVDMTGISGFPSDQEGWGRVLLNNGLHFTGDTRKLLMLDDIRNANGITTGARVAYQVAVESSGEPLKVTLVWTEKEATIGANPAYINNLDLLVTAPGDIKYNGNTFSGGQSVPGGATDIRNNVEQVLLNSPAPGAYLIEVIAATVNTVGPQGYALIVTGDVAAPSPVPAVHAIVPSVGETDTMVAVTELSGNNFQSGATVHLSRVGEVDIVATNVNVVNANTITCEFDLANALVGLWDVVVENADAQTGVLPGGFEVTVTCVPGDMNNDGLVNGDDIQAFVDALLMDVGTQRQLCAADLNSDTLRNTDDLRYFVYCLMGTEGCPSP
jgi:hypothetical protein